MDWITSLSGFPANDLFTTQTTPNTNTYIKIHTEPAKTVYFHVQQHILILFYSPRNGVDSDGELGFAASIGNHGLTLI